MKRTMLTVLGCVLAGCVGAAVSPMRSTSASAQPEGDMLMEMRRTNETLAHISEVLDGLAQRGKPEVAFLGTKLDEVRAELGGRLGAVAESTASLRQDLACMCTKAKK